MFAHHVFISYSHIDNLPLNEEHKGWISNFHNTLNIFLSGGLGSYARIWRDSTLQGNDIVNEEIGDAYRDTTLFFLILTPRYVRSDWCRREVQEFCQHAESSDGLIIDNKSRVFKVIKIPVKPTETEMVLPDVVHKSLAYEFYVEDEHGPIELDPIFGKSYKEKYYEKIKILANDAVSLIKRVEAKKAEAMAADAATIIQDSTDTTIASSAKKTVIFLASCSFDQRDQRELIEADLRSHGYRVLPEQRLPGDEDEHRQAVAALLEEAHFSLHLIGAHYGAVPDGPSQLSQAEIQNTMAAERSASHRLSRLIWLPQSTSSDHPAHCRFLESLRRQQGPQQGADLLSGSFEELRTELHTSLERLEAPPPSSPSPPEDADGAVDTVTPGAADGLATAGRMLYLICVADDRSPTQPLRKWLEAQGWEVVLPAFVGDAAALRKTHESLLLECRAVLIFYGAGDEAWQRSVDMDLRRAPAYRKGAPLAPPFTYLAGPTSLDKEDMVAMEKAHIVDGRQGFDPTLLQLFLQSLDTAAARP